MTGHMAKETKKPDQQAQSASAPTTYDWSQTGVSGFEATRQEDLGIPFLSILQDNSPQIKISDPNYEKMKIIGAGVGDIINTLSNTVLHVRGRDPIQFIPCYHERLYVEWTPREKGGGIVQSHRNANILLECTRDKISNRDVHKNGNHIVTTSYFYGLIIRDKESPIPAIIGMASTQLANARDWLNLMMAIRIDGPNGKFQPPAFSHIYNISTIAENNKKGSWFGWNIQIRGQLSDPTLIAKAIETSKEAQRGQRAALPPPSDNPLQPPAHDADDVPFK